MRLSIHTIGEQVLRQHARLLTHEEIKSFETQQLIEHMRETMYDAPGVGLAAPQIGQPIQLAVIEDKQEYMAGLTPEQIAERERKAIPFHVLINPVLRLGDGAPVEFFEGCLSLPGLTAIVARSPHVTVECLDHRAKPRTIEATGWYARILQHEIDHLAGTLYVDRMLSRTLTSIENYNRLWKARASDEVKDSLEEK